MRRRVGGVSPWALPTSGMRERVKERANDIMSALEGTRGLLVSLVNIFDEDGTHELTRKEFSDSAKVLGYDTSDQAWGAMRKRFGAKMSDLGEEFLDLSLVGDHFRSGPGNPVLEELFRKLLGGMVALSARVHNLEDSVDAVEAKSASTDKNRLKRIMLRWQNGLLAIAFGGWAEDFRKRKELLNKTARAWANAALAAVWRQWMGMVAEAKEHRSIIARVLGRMSNRLAATVFATWWAQVEETRAQWAVAAQAVGRMMNRVAAQAFDTWHQAVEEAKEQRAAVARVLARMMNRLSAQAFDAWHEAVEEAKEQRRRVARVVAQWRNRAVLETFSAWRYAVHDASRQRWLMLQKVVGRMKSRTLAMAFERWLEEVVHRKDVLARARAIAGRMLNALSGRCFDAWIEFIDEQRRIFRRAAFAIGPMRLLYLAMRTWAEKVQDAILRRRTEGVLDEQLSMRVAALFEGQMENSVAGSVDRFLGGRMSALDRMKEQVTTLMEDMKSVESKMQTKIAELPETVAEASRAALRVAQWEEKQRKEAEKRARDNEEDRLREMRVKKVVRRWKHKYTSLVFDAWAAILKAAKEALARAARTWANVGIAKAWRLWAEISQERARARRLARRVVGRMAHKMLALCLSAWAEVTVEIRKARQAEEAAREARARAAEQEERERKMLDALRTVGGRWFDEMQLELMQGLQAEQPGAAAHGNGHAQPEPRRVIVAHPNRTLSEGALKPQKRTMLELLDERYNLGGPPRGTQYDRDLMNLNHHMCEHLTRLNEECSFLKSIVRNVVKEPAIAKPASPRSLRPLRLPPQWAPYFYTEGGSPVESGPAPSRTVLRNSRSVDSLAMGASPPGSLAAVRVKNADIEAAWSIKQGAQ